jgi:hypothetical protein
MPAPAGIGDARLDLALAVPVFGRGCAIFHVRTLRGWMAAGRLAADQAAGGAARETARSRATM